MSRGRVAYLEEGEVNQEKNPVSPNEPEVLVVQFHQQSSLHYAAPILYLLSHLHYYQL